MVGYEPKGLKLTRKEQTIKYYKERISFIDFQIDDQLKKKKRCELKIKELKLNKKDIISRMKDVQKELVKC